MAKKQAAASTSTPPKAGKSVSSSHQTASKSPPSLSSRSTAQEVARHIWKDYLQNTPARTFLLDAFMAFLVLIGGIQFLYAVLFGNYPFNAFLSGFSAAVGQFVLTASLRMQTSEQLPPTASAEAKKIATKKMDNAGGGGGGGGGGAGAGSGSTEDNVRVSSERAFADYVFGSLILHAFCVNFIN